MTHHSWSIFTNWVLGNTVLDGLSVPYDPIVNEIQHFFRLILKHINQPKKDKGSLWKHCDGTKEARHETLLRDGTVPGRPSPMEGGEWVRTFSMSSLQRFRTYLVEYYLK